MNKIQLSDNLYSSLKIDVFVIISMLINYSLNPLNKKKILFSFRLKFSDFYIVSVLKARVLCLAKIILWESVAVFFSSPGPKGQVSYCHHLASVVVVGRKFFQKSSPLKLLDQLKPNLVWIITRVSSFKIVSSDAVHQPTWPLLLKIEHMVKLQVFG